jgi:hypothetical protein
MHAKSIYTQQHCYVSLKTFVGIQTLVFSFLRRVRCPLRNAAGAFQLMLYICFLQDRPTNTYLYIYVSIVCLTWENLHEPNVPMFEKDVCWRGFNLYWVRHKLQVHQKSTKTAM